ncbi:Hypothetical predicted protein [Olea europaea subsp. europaea]|uniref:Uncharacterized protein n=1 Tax=Olea europaea subsp. europaea TaxID=158383 RepID=A0A8S0Q071_OLEEU|nr:Hypothetical predicted protein [Olea europaea subsp. europaea]
MVQLQNQFLENSPFVGDGTMVADELLEPNVQIINLGGRRSRSLLNSGFGIAMVELLIVRPQKRRSYDRKIHILDVPYDTVSVFVFLQFRYSSKSTSHPPRPLLFLPFSIP